MFFKDVMPRSVWRKVEQAGEHAAERERRKEREKFLSEGTPTEPSTTTGSGGAEQRADAAAAAATEIRKQVVDESWILLSPADRRRFLSRPLFSSSSALADPHSFFDLIRSFKRKVLRLQRAVRRFLLMRDAQLQILSMLWDRVVFRYQKKVARYMTSTKAAKRKVWSEREPNEGWRKDEPSKEGDNDSKNGRAERTESPKAKGGRASDSEEEERRERIKQRSAEAQKKKEETDKAQRLTDSNVLSASTLFGASGISEIGVSVAEEMGEGIGNAASTGSAAVRAASSHFSVRPTSHSHKRLRLVYDFKLTSSEKKSILCQLLRRRRIDFARRKAKWKAALSKYVDECREKIADDRGRAASVQDYFE